MWKIGYECCSTYLSLMMKVQNMQTLASVRVIEYTNKT